MGSPKSVEKDIEKIVNRLFGVPLNDHKSLKMDIEEILGHFGFFVKCEYECRYNRRRGRIDLVAWKNISGRNFTIGIEIDDELPRYKSINKLNVLNPELSIIVLRSTRIKKEEVLERVKNLRSSYILLDLHNRNILGQKINSEEESKMNLEGIVREYYEIREEIKKLEKRRRELRENIFNTFSTRNTDEIYAGDIWVYRVNRPKVIWEENELKSILLAKGLWDEVVTVDNQKFKNLIDEGKISEAEIENCKRKTDRWYIYAERKAGRIRIKDLQKGVGFSELYAIVVGKGELRQGISRVGKKWRVNHLFIKDKTGSIKLVLWNENTKIAEDINVGDRIVVKNGYVSEYVRGDDRELQISLRKDSDVVVIGAKEEMEDLEEKAEDLEEDEEEIEEAIEGGYAYEVYEGYKEDSWRGKS